MFERVRIASENGITKVYVGDKQIRGVKEITFHQSVEEAPSVSISIISNQVDFEIDGATVEILNTDNQD